jgi:hypothetical protein
MMVMVPARKQVARPSQRCFCRNALDFADIVVDARDDIAEARARVESR